MAGWAALSPNCWAKNTPHRMKRIGMQDRFGESGKPEELLEHFGLDAKHIRLAAHAVIENKR